MGVLSDSAIMVACRCDSCGRLLVGYTTDFEDGAFSRWPEWLARRDAPMQWVPPAADRREFPDVPTHIAEAATEAYLCLSLLDARRAAVQLARSVIEATAKDQGVSSGNLLAKIDAMFERRLIRETVKDGAHEVRHLGNDMAHGDFVEPVSREDAALVLTLMSELLDEVYEAPARVARARDARRTRNAGADGTG